MIPNGFWILGLLRQFLVPIFNCNGDLVTALHSVATQDLDTSVAKRSDLLRRGRNGQLSNHWLCTELTTGFDFPKLFRDYEVSPGMIRPIRETGVAMYICPCI